jgi:DNA-binding transcriptional regulator/RsmH inhibitor MraZ
MKKLIYAFVAIIVCSEIFNPLNAVNQPNVDEIEQMLKKIEGNLKMAQAVTSVAKAQGEKLVESKVQEKKELKENLEQAKEELKVAEEKVEVFSTRMIEVGLDTALKVEVPQEAKLAGPLYDEWLEYKKNGGESDFEYYRLYKK